MPTHVNDYTIPKGKYYWDEWDAADNPQGEEYLGNTPGSDLSIESQVQDHFSADSGVSEKDDTTVIQIDRANTITVDNITAANIARFLSASLADLIQAAATVTDDDKPIATADRYYQMGKAADGASGVRGISAVTMKAKEGDDASAWVTATAYAVGAVVIPGTPNDHWYMATVGGTSDVAEPTFPTDGSTVADNDITWQDMGPILYVKDTDYEEVSLPLGRIYTMPGGNLATAVALAAAVGVTFGLRFGYDRASNTRVQIKTGDARSVTGSLRLIADNPKGTNRDFYFPKVTLTPTGTLSLKSAESNYQEMQFEMEIGKRDDTTEAIYVDGRAA